MILGIRERLEVMKYNKIIMEEALEVIIDYRGKTPKKSESGVQTLSAKSVKNNYIEKNGMADGAGKTEIYMDMYRQMKSDDRLSAGYTLRQYHLAYTQAFVSAIKAVDPTWEYGKAVPSGALDSVTRESVESQLVKSGNTFVKKSSSGSTLDMKI